MQDEIIRGVPAVQARRLWWIGVGAVVVFGLTYSSVPASFGYLLTAVLAGGICVAAGWKQWNARPESWGVAPATCVPMMLCMHFVVDWPFFYAPPPRTEWRVFLLVLMQWMVVWGFTFLGAAIGLRKWQKRRAEQMGEVTS